MSKPKENTWSNYALRILINTASHPLDYAKVLIQIGHEPIAPKPTTTLFGKPALKLPNVFQYVKHIKSVDGFSGCYRGLVPKLCGNLTSAVASQKVLEYMEINVEDSYEEDLELNEEQKRTQLLKSIRRDLISRTTAIIVSHPFTVISVRMMAQFVGGESTYKVGFLDCSVIPRNYASVMRYLEEYRSLEHSQTARKTALFNGLLQSFVEVYRENGIGGFFAGLIPRVLGDAISVILAHVLSYIVNSFILEENDLRMYTSATMSFIASAVTYPFQVVSNCMAVTNSGLMAGRPPNMPIYTSWLDCWQHLSSRHELKRGSSLLVRYYVGPQVIIDGRAVPVSSSGPLLKKLY